MLKTPIDSLPNNAVPTVKCVDPLPAGTYPLPRCISNEFAYNLGPYIINLKRQNDLRSKRRTNHMATWFGQYVSFDITTSMTTIPSNPIYIPADDATFNPPGSIPGKLSASGVTSIPFNLSETLSNVTDPLNSVRNGISYVTPFLDLDTIYGTSDSRFKSLRDGTSCKLSTSDNGKYPPKDTDGDYVKSAGTSSRSWSIFTMAINTLWIREHNRKCDELFKIHGNSWTNQQYFNEARRWNIAFFQKTTSEEYLGTVIGRPLPAYQGYKPNLVPGIDTFFATVSFRYGHTELSDKYRIQDQYGDKMVDLTLDQVAEESLLETFSLERVLSSMALQRQEEVDAFFSDAPRTVNSSNIYDLYAFDVSRARDRGIALYNTVRESYGLSRKNTWNEVTSDQYLLDRLQWLYPNGPDTIEAFVGAYCEDHLDGSNFGELLNASIVTQFNHIRETDKNWWESPEAFNDSERAILRETTFRDIITRNLEIDGIDVSQFVRSIWTVQPFSELEGEKDDKNISPWSPYSIKYNLDNSHINFEVELQTSGGQGWFGMGFDPTDNGMTNAEFIVGIVKDKDVDLSYYKSDGGYHPPLRDSPAGLEIKSKSVDPTSGVAKIQFRRLLEPPNRKPIRQAQMKYIMAYNPTSSGFSYHGNNRQMSLINFYTRELGAADIQKLQRVTRLLHGIGMFITWCVLFPISIFVVRFLKHTNNYLKIHRAIQLLGGISISSFGAAAIATMTSAKSPHAWTGLIIYTLVFFELGLGLLSIWGQAAVVSVNHGYPRLTKRVHKIFGATLLLASWINIYLGIDTFTLSFSYNPLFWKISYGVWMLALIIIFIAGEYWWRKEGSFSRLYNTEEDAELDRRKSTLYINKDYDNLPEFTWEDVNEHVQRGAFLVVCDELVVDIRKWIGVHPGGAKILEEVIGTDITNEFYNTHKKTNIVEDVETPETRLLSGYNNHEKHRNKSEEQKFGILIRRQSVAKIIDKINTKYFSNSPLATHRHSAFATKKMMGMVIGKINENPFIEPVSPVSPESPILMSFSSKVKEGTRFDDNMMSQRIKFRRYKLTSRLTINNSEKYPVIKFTFTKVYQDEKDNWDEVFLPGHYVEVKSRVRGQVVVRSYTPVEGRLSKSFSIYVKIYPSGLMSTHLSKQLKGFEIQVRGPFDVLDRLKSTSNAPAQGETLRRLSFQILPPPTKSAKSSLLNPNSLDGCWDELFMICGGTGITPMLQLIKYHLLHAKKSENVEERDRRIHMYLLYGNNGAEDVIDSGALRDYETSNRGMLKISYVFSNLPPIEWRPYLQGIISSDIIQKWFSDIKTMKSRNLTAQPSLDFSPTFQPYPPYHQNPQHPQVGATSSATYTPQILSSPKSIHNDTKIVVCGSADMMMVVNQTLVEMGYSENDYIMLV